MATTYRFKITRYDPERSQFTTEDYSIQAPKKITVLAALHLINRQHQISLSYRFSCEMGICGSCGATVNGKPVLTCHTFCNQLAQPIEISPLRNFPVIKDLVVDISGPFNKMRWAMPYTNLTINKSPTLAHELLQSPENRKKIDQTSQCIKCMLCYSACPVYNSKRDFVGPAVAALADRYNRDARATLKNERMDAITGNDGVWNCTFVGECSVVCPKNVDPAKALQKLKAAGMFHLLKKIKPQNASKRTKKSP